MNAKHLSPERLSERRLNAVRLRLDGLTVAETARRTGLSPPTVSAAWKAFREGGWDAVPLRPRGRPTGQAPRLGETQQRLLSQKLATWPTDDAPGWTSRTLASTLTEAGAGKVSSRAIDHWLEAQDLKPLPLPLNDLARRRSRAGRWYRQQVQPVLEQVYQADGTHWQGGVRIATGTTGRLYQLYLHGKRGALYTHCLAAPPRADDYLTLFARLADPGPTSLVFHGAYFQASPEMRQWLEQNPQMHLVTVPADAL